MQDAVNTLALTTARGALEHSVEPVSVSTNATVEVGWAAPEFASVKVAVKVTDWFTKEDASEEVTASVRFAGLTVRFKGEDELATKFVSPLYAAVILYVPCAGSEELHVEIPVAGVTLAAAHKLTGDPPFST